MKKVTIAITLSFLFISTYSQSCLPEGIEFYSQAQIDSFQINYPGCTEIEGSVWFGFVGNDITSLAGLDVLTSIGGSLGIGSEGAANSAGTDLINLEGLEGLDSIHGGLFIISNPELIDISALDGLNYIGGHLHISRNGSLATCQSEGLCNYLLNPNSTVTIYNNAPGCNSVVDLGAICNDSIPCLPYGNYYLLTQTDIDNFQNVFPGCIELVGNLLIVAHGGHGKKSSYSVRGSTISNLDGLSVITSIGGELYISENDSLESLSGIDNIDEYSITALVIEDNQVLSICEVLSVCNYIDLSGSQVDIDDNAPGCNSQGQVQYACESVLVDEQYLQENIRIFPNPANQELNISTEGYIIQDVRIYNLTGQQVLQRKPEGSLIDISTLHPGMYIVEVTVENTRLRQKLLVQR